VRFKESSVFVLLSVFAFCTACRDSTSPPERHQAQIFAIQTSPRAAVTDTIHVSFQFSTSPCDSDVVVESQFEPDGIRLGVSSVGPRMCQIAITRALIPPFLYVVGPEHQTPFTVRFAEPGEADSVRVIPAQ
jgi:hypothetical protein